MDADTWRQIQELFDCISEAPISDRDSMLVNADVSPEIRSRVESMLKHAEDGSNPQDGPAAQLADVIQSAINDLGYTPLEPGTVVGRYTIVRLIASGGMGDVYFAHTTEGVLQIPVAIKVSRHPSRVDIDSHKRNSDRFTFEREVLLRLDHPSIPRILDTGTTPDGLEYFSMEFVDGHSIDKYCRANGISIRTRVEIAKQVCDAIHHAHQRLVIHRDIKPSNILVRKDGMPRVLDFGIASEMNQVLDRARLTRTGEFVGTLAYASPEQLDGSSTPDTRSDVYSLGVVLYELLTESLPHSQTTSLPMLLDQIRTSRPPSPASLNSSIDPDLSAVVMQSIARDPDRRYPSAAEFGADLQNYLENRPVHARADSRWYVIRSEIKLRRVPIFVALIILVASLAFGIYATSQSKLLSNRNMALVDALSRESVERARLLSQTGSLIGAERLLWPHYLEGERRAQWALRDLYTRFPVQATVRLPFQPDSIHMLNHHEVVAIDEAKSKQWRVDLYSATMTPYTDSGTGVISGVQQSVPEWSDSIEWIRTNLGESISIAHSFPTALGYMLLCDDQTIRSVNGTGDIKFSFPSAPLGRSRTMIAATQSESHIAQVTDSDIWLFNREIAETIRLEGANGWIEAVCFLESDSQPDLLVACSSDNLLRVWRLDTNELILESNAFDSTPTYALPVPGSHDFVTAEKNGILRIWDLNNLTHPVPGDAKPETALAFDIDSNTNTIGVGVDGTPHRFVLFDQSTQTEIARHEWNAPICSTRSANSPGSWYFADYSGGVTKLFHNEETLDVEWSTTLDTRPNSITLSPNGQMLAVACDTGKIALLDSSDGSVIQVISINAIRVPSISWHPIREELVVCTYPESDLVLISDPAGSARISLLYDGDPQTGARAVTHSPDGSRIAFGGDDALIRIFEYSDDQHAALTNTLGGHNEGLFTLDYSPTGDLLISAGRSGRVIVWDTIAGELLARLNASDRMLFSARFHDTAGLIFTSGIGNNVYKWDLGSLDEQIARNHPARTVAFPE